MSTRRVIHIERLVLHGVALTPQETRRLGPELERALGDARLGRVGDRPRVDAGTVRLGGSESASLVVGKVARRVADTLKRGEQS